MKSMRKIPKLYIVVPCYNEEEVLLETTKQLANKLNELIKNKLIITLWEYVYLKIEVIKMLCWQG